MAIRGSSLAGAIIPLGGPAGLSGQSTYAAWLALGNTGSLADFMAAQKGADGLIRSIGGVAKSAVDLDDLKITFGGVQRGLPSAVSLFNDRTAVSIFEYLPAQYHNAIAAGTLATGIAGDLTAAWAAAAAQIGDAELFHPPGRYLLDGEAILNAPLALAMKGVRFLQIAAPGNGNRGMIRVNSGAARTRVLGAPGFDGNRDALIDAYRAGDVINQGNRYSVAGSWAAVFVNGAEDVYIPVIRAKNMMTMGLLHLAGDGLMVDHMRVRNSSKILLSQFARGGVIEDVWGDQISNVAGGKTVPTYQYAVECRNLTQSRFGTLRVTNYAPLLYDGTASSASAMGVGDPHGGAVTFDHMDGIDVGAIRAVSYGPASPDARVSNVAWGFVADSMRAMKVGHIETKGYYWGIEERTWIGCQIGSVDLDGQGNTASDGSGVAVSAGIRTKGYGGLPSNLSLSSSFDHYSVVPSRDNVWGGGVVQRFTHGVHLIVGGHTFIGVLSTNNEQQGWLSWKSEPGPFGKKLPINVKLIECSGRANGQAGKLIFDADEIDIIGGSWDDNGQRTTDPQYAAGIALGLSSVKGRIRIVGGSASDTQNWTEAGGVSFAPGMVGSDGLWPIVLATGGRKRPGQVVTIVNGAR